MSIPYPGSRPEPDPLTNRELRLIPKPAASEIYRLRSKLQAWQKAGNAFIDLVYAVESRCMAADGPVTPTLKEMTEDEFRHIYEQINKALR